MNVKRLEKESVEVTYISWSRDFSSLGFARKNILVFLAKPDSGELRCPATALISIQTNGRTCDFECPIHRITNSGKIEGAYFGRVRSIFLT